MPSKLPLLPLLAGALSLSAPSFAAAGPSHGRDLSRAALVCAAHAPLARTVSRLADRGLKQDVARGMVAFTASVDPRLAWALNDTVDEIYKGNPVVSALAAGGGWATVCAGYLRRA